MLLESHSDYRKRKWSLVVIYFTTFLMALGFSIIITGVWPYLDKVSFISPPARSCLLILQFVAVGPESGQGIHGPRGGGQSPRTDHLQSDHRVLGEPPGFDQDPNVGHSDRVHNVQCNLLLLGAPAVPPQVLDVGLPVPGRRQFSEYGRLPVLHQFSDENGGANKSRVHGQSHAGARLHHRPSTPGGR